MLPALLILVLVQSPDSLQDEAASPEVQKPAETVVVGKPHVDTTTPRPWLPWQGHLAFQGMLIGSFHTLGMDAYLGRTSGLVRFEPSGHGGGGFWGYGLHATFGSTQTPHACHEAEYCIGRWFLAPSVRAGWAWGFFRVDEATPIPDGYLYGEVSPFFGRTSVDSAPLNPGSAYFENGIRFALGMNLVGWTRLATGGLGGFLAESHSADNLYAVILWLALALTNHFEANVELSRGIAGPLVRGGFSVGAGF
ncbi:MAG: hypothetical protein ACJ790_19285 [Myxococcaceae bacterium]